jgi:hypothetical protein
MKNAGRIAGCGLLVAAALLAGCRKKSDPQNAAAAPPVHVDTTDNNPMDGVSDQQLEAKAQALTPEQAAAQGMVDTTTHLEDEGSPLDTTAPGGSKMTDTTAGVSKAKAAAGRSSNGAPARTKP